MYNQSNKLQKRQRHVKHSICLKVFQGQERILKTKEILQRERKCSRCGTDGNLKNKSPTHSHTYFPLEERKEKHDKRKQVHSLKSLISNKKFTCQKPNHRFPRTTYKQ